MCNYLCLVWAAVLSRARLCSAAHLIDGCQLLLHSLTDDRILSMVYADTCNKVKLIATKYNPHQTRGLQHQELSLKFDGSDTT